MTTILAAIVGLILAGATAFGVAHSMSDTAQRVPAGSQTSHVVLYGQR